MKLTAKAKEKVTELAKVAERMIWNDYAIKEVCIDLAHRAFVAGAEFEKNGKARLVG